MKTLVLKVLMNLRAFSAFYFFIHICLSLRDLGKYPLLTFTIISSLINYPSLLNSCGQLMFSFVVHIIQYFRTVKLPY